MTDKCFDDVREQLIESALRGLKVILSPAMDGTMVPHSDPRVIALEAAAYGTADRSKSPLEAARAALLYLPVNATEFERGLTFGIAVLLAVGREHG